MKREHLTSLAKIGRCASSGQGLPHVLGCVLDEILDSVGATLGMLFVRNLHDGTLSLSANRGLNDDFVRSYTTRAIVSGEGLTGRIAESGQALYIRDQCFRDPRAARGLATNTDLNSFLGVPILSGDSVVGVLNVLTRNADVLDESQVDFVQLVAFNAGTAIVRASLAADLAAANARQELFATAIANASETFAILDADGIIQSSNAAFEDAVDRSGGALAGMPYSVACRMSQNDPVVLTIHNALHTGEPWTGTIEGQRSDGARLVLAGAITSVPASVETGVGRFVAAMRDVTSLVALQEHAQRNQRADVLGLVMGGITHDFNNILTTILVSSSRAIRAVDSTSPIGEDLAAIHHAGKDAAKAIERLVSFDSADESPASVELSHFVSEAVRTIERLVPEHIEFRISCDLQLQVRASFADLMVILLNVTKNASEAMPNGGVLHVSSIALELTTHEQDVGPGAYACLRIRDEGSGMSRQTLQRVFDPGFTTKGPGGGGGLLAVRKIVEQLGGNMRIESIRDVGTEVRLLLPIETISKETPRLGDSLPRSITAALTQQTVLLVEDQTCVRKTLSRALSAGGYTVVEACDAAQALSIVFTQKITPALVIADVVMPKMNGDRLAELLRKHHPTMPILFISGHSPSNVTLPDESELIRKPIQADELLERVGQVLKQVDRATGSRS